MELFLIIVGVITSFMVFYFVCWYLPRRYNKFVYIVYGMRNPINLKSNFVGFIVFVIGFVFIYGNYTNEYAFVFSIALGGICIFASIYLCSYIIIKSNIVMKHKVLGCFLASASMLLVIFEIFGLISDLKKPNKGAFTKTLDTGIHVFAIVAFRPELQEQEFARIDSQKLKHPNLNYSNLKFLF